MDYKIKSRIWIEADGHILLGEGRVTLLKAIGKYGSLSKAAKSLGMSYKKAWSLVDALNKRGESLIVTTSIGGKGGGGTTITPYGQSLIEAFDRLKSSCWDFLDEQISKTDLHVS